MHVVSTLLQPAPTKPVVLFRDLAPGATFRLAIGHRVQVKVVDFRIYDGGRTERIFAVYPHSGHATYPDGNAVVIPVRADLVVHPEDVVPKMLTTSQSIAREDYFGGGGKP